MSILDFFDKVADFAIKNEGNINKAISYLKKYGYLRKEVKSVEDLLLVINKFQSISGINQTGILDGQTLRIMDYPRCSLPDIYEDEDIVENASDFAKWGKKELNYFIASTDGDMSKELWFATIKKAFDNISAICGLTFTQVNSLSQSNLVLDTGRGRSDDFDGSSGTLAWFQLPTTSNFMGRLSGKFDLDEFWLGNGQSGRGIYLLNVATHEICHGLGLRHSKVNSALMAPIYSPSIAVPQQNDDIPRLQNLYGKPVVSKPNPEPEPTPPPKDSKTTIISINGNVESISIPGYRITKIS